MKPVVMAIALVGREAHVRTSQRIGRNPYVMSAAALCWRLRLR
jgi:hypothetical protein